jgi:hypothetical protein
VAKKTPDYTKQSRQTRQRERTTVAPVSKAMAYMVYASLLGAVGLFCFGLYLVGSNLSDAGANDRAILVTGLGMLGGIVCNFLVFLLSMHVFDRRKHPLRGINKTVLMWAIILSGMVCVMVVMSSKFWQTLMGPGLIPAIAVMVFILRPRLKAMAIAEGRYTQSRSEKAREDYERERDARRAEKERYEALKRARLGKPAAAAASSGKAGGGQRKQGKSAPTSKGSKAG